MLAVWLEQTLTKDQILGALSQPGLFRRRRLRRRGGGAALFRQVGEQADDPRGGDAGRHDEGADRATTRVERSRAPPPSAPSWCWTAWSRPAHHRRAGRRRAMRPGVASLHAPTGRRRRSISSTGCRPGRGDGQLADRDLVVETTLDSRAAGRRPRRAANAAIDRRCAPRTSSQAALVAAVARRRGARDGRRRATTRTASSTARPRRSASRARPSSRSSTWPRWRPG